MNLLMQSLDKLILFILMLAVGLQRVPIRGANHLYAVAIVLFLYWCYKNKINVKKQIEERAGSSFLKAYGLFCICFMPSIVFSDMIGRSLQEFLKYFFSAFFPFVMALVVVKDKKTVEKLCLGVILIICADACVALYQSLVLHISTAPGISGHYLKLAGYLACMVPMVMVFALDSTFSKYFRYFSAIVVVILLLCGFAASKSRALWCILLIIIPIIVLCYRKSFWQYKTLCIVALAGVCLIGGFFLSSEKNLARLKSSVNTTTNGSNLDRLRMWRSASWMVKDYPLTGVGFGNYKRVYQGQYEVKNIHSYDHPHNGYVLLGAEAGIPGFLAIVGATLALLFTSLKKWWSTNNGYYYALFVSWLGFSIFNLIEPIIMYEIITMPMSFLSGCFLACIYLDKQKEGQEHV